MGVTGGTVVLELRRVLEYTFGMSESCLCDSKSTNAFPGRRAVRVIVVLDPAKVSGVGFKIKQHFHAFFSVSKIKTR